MTQLGTFSQGNFVTTELLPLLIRNYSFQNFASEKLFAILPVFLNEKLIGYLDMNNQIGELNLILNKSNFNSKSFNCLLQTNVTNGLLEMYTCKDLMPNEQIVCWFAESFLKNLKSNYFILFCLFSFSIIIMNFLFFLFIK
jgi:hypothetical protein